MARTKINEIALKEFNTQSAEFDMNAIGVAVNGDGGYYTHEKKDESIVFIVRNASTSATGAVKIHAGNGIQGNGDLTVTVTKEKTVIVSVESGRFKHVSGENKGQVLFSSTSADLKVSVLKLP